MLLRLVFSYKACSNSKVNLVTLEEENFYMKIKNFFFLLLSVLTAYAVVHFITPTISASPLSSKAFLSIKMNKSDTVHFLNRVAFGSEPHTFIIYSGKSRKEAIDHVLSSIRTTSLIPPPNWVHDQAPPFWGRSDMMRGDQNHFDTTRTKEFKSLKRWWVREIAQTKSPLTERLVLFWHNHFVSAYSGVGRWSISLFRQNKTFRRFGGGSFRTLLTRSLKEPALLKYLDADKNKKGKPNENLGRELLELFTLGEGEYTEKDVKEVSRALTGWRTARFKNLTFHNDKWAHDRELKTIFGKTGYHSQEDLINLLLDHPRTSEFISEKFWRYFVSETWKDKKTIQHSAKIFRESGYNITELLRSLLESKAFWSPKARGSIIKSPVDFVLGTIRSLRVSPQNFKQTENTLKNMGQELFNPPNVGGWPGFRSWVTPSGLIERVKYVQNLTSTGGVVSDPKEIKNIEKYFAFISKHKERTIDIFGERIEVDPNTFSAQHFLSAYGRGFGTKRRPNLTIGFINARLNKTFWGTLAIGFDVRKEKGFRIKFREHKCYPRCFNYDNLDEFRKRYKGLNIELRDSSQKVFRKIRLFNNDEKKMVAIVAGSLDVIAELLSNGRRFERSQKNRDWATYLQEQSQKFKNKSWIKQILKSEYQLTASHGYRPKNKQMGMMMSGKPNIDGIMPGGYTPIDNPAGLREANPKIFKNINLADYLMVLPGEFEGKENNLLGILTSPVYNVR